MPPTGTAPGSTGPTCVPEAFRASFHRTLGETVYDVHVAWDSPVRLRRTAEHCYEFVPETGRNEIAFVVCFDRIVDNAALPSFDRTAEESARHWRRFWESGGAIDLSESSDPRWRELERRVVLSQYVMAVNEAGSLPPQESGLVNNGWYGKYHYEMIWWHCAHYALWNRWELASEMMRVFTDNLGVFRRKGRGAGVCRRALAQDHRRPRVVGVAARDHGPADLAATPSDLLRRAWSTGSARRARHWRSGATSCSGQPISWPPTRITTRCATAMCWGYPLQVVGENADPRTTINPAFELSYWRTGLRLAQQWRVRLGLPEKREYDEVLRKLSPLPVEEGVYVSWENIERMWTSYNWEHPALVGAYGMLPGDGVDIPTMRRTLAKVHAEWKLGETWGWDFPMLAMCAARLGDPERAVEYLLDYPAFDFDPHGLVGGGRAPFPTSRETADCCMPWR